MSSVKRYQFAASFSDGVVAWTFFVQTEDGETHAIPIRDGEEIPLLVQICRSDATIYFDPKTRTLRTGWSSPGKDPAQH